MMKKTIKVTIAAAFLGLFVTNSMAQIPTDVQDFTSHGVHVILRNTQANDVVGAYLGFEGGLAYGEASNPVLANATASVLAESGSQDNPKDKYRDELEKLSTSIGGSGDIYKTAYTLRTIAPNFSQAWDIFSDVILHPTFDTIEFRRLTKQMANGIAARATNPEAYTDFVLDSLWQGKSPLNRTPTVQDVQSLKVVDLARYYNQMKERSRMLLVIVGKVTRQEIENKLARFEAIPVGDFKMRPVDRFAEPTSSYSRFMTRQLPTTYVAARFPSAALGSKDWWAERIMMQILDKRLFDEVRTKRNLSYAPGGYATGTHGNYYGQITLQSILPDSAIGVVLNELHKLQTKPVGAQELEDAKAARITTFFYVMQTNLDQARNLFNNQMETGDWRNLFRVTDESAKVTAADIQRVADKYMHHLVFVTLGPEGAVSNTRFKYD